MNHRVFFALSFALGLSLLTQTAAAQSRSSSSPEGFRIGGLLGGGVVVNNDNAPPYNLNPMGFGLGAQGGYTFGFGLYVGADLRWFLGQQLPYVGGNQRINTLQFTFDLGYDVRASRHFVLRPLLGLGASRYKEKLTYSGSKMIITDAGFLLSLGFEGIYDITDMFWIGAQIRFPFAFMGGSPSDIYFHSGGTDVAFQGVATVGLRF